MSTKNRFAILVDENDCLLDPDNCELHSQLSDSDQHATQCNIGNSDGDTWGNVDNTTMTVE